MDGGVAYRVELAGYVFDVTVAADGDALAVEVGDETAPVASEQEGSRGAAGAATESANGAEPRSRILQPAADGAARTSPGTASADRFRVGWRGRGTNTYTLSLTERGAESAGAAVARRVAEVELAPGGAVSGGSGLAGLGSASQGYWVALDGHEALVTVTEARALRLAAALPRRSTSASTLEIRAPMPGRVVSIRVSEGATVDRGDLVATLEAMKMENELRAPGQGRVQAIRVSEGDTVEHNALLLVLTPPSEPGAGDSG